MTAVQIIESKAVTKGRTEQGIELLDPGRNPFS